MKIQIKFSYIYAFLLSISIALSFIPSEARLGNFASMASAFRKFVLIEKVADDALYPYKQEANAQFGTSLDISGDIIIIGAPLQDTDQNGVNSLSNAGAAFIFTRNGASWVQQQKIVPTGTNARVASDSFGISVAISGTTVAIGASGQDFDELGANNISGAGAVYIFTRTGTVWSQQQKIVPTGTNARVASDSFGTSISLDGSNLIVGAAGQDFDVNGASSIAQAGAAFIFTRSGTVWSQQQKIVGIGTNARIASDSFGFKVAISGNTVAVSANNQDFDAAGAASVAQAGAVYIFTRTGTIWSQQQKVVPTGTNSRIITDYFGQSLSLHNDTLVAGAYFQDYDSAGASSVGDAGAVYVFTRTGTVWTQQQKMSASGTNSRILSDNFGSDVFVFDNTIVVGAYRQDFDESGANSVDATGAVFIFTRTGTVWSQQQKIVANGTNSRNATDNYGVKVAAFGNIVIVGANFHDYDSSGIFSSGAGAAFTYSRSGATWSQQNWLVASEPDYRSNGGDWFGVNVAVNNETLVIGASRHGLDASGSNSLSQAGAAYVYTRNGNLWGLQQKIVPVGTNARLFADNFGIGVAIFDNTIVVGASQQDYDENGANSLDFAGAAYVFTRTGTVWSQQQKLVPSGLNARVANVGFGNIVSIYEQTIVVASSTHDFDENGANSLTNAGAVFVFTRTGTVWTQQQRIVPTGTNARSANDVFGVNAHIHKNTLVVGASLHDFDETGANSVTDAGAVFIFTRTGTVWSQQQKIVPSGANARTFSYFGNNVSVYENLLVVGSSAHAFDETGANSINGAGAAYVFSRSGTVWTQQQKLVPTGLNARADSDNFGTSVSMYGDFIIIGAYQHDYDESGGNSLSNTGAAFVFSRSGAIWSQQSKIVGTGTNARNVLDSFGYSVSINKNTALVGAFRQDFDSNGENPSSEIGAAYIFGY